MRVAIPWSQRLLRIGSDTRHDRWLDALLLLGVCGLLIATGIGLRDPWPADEPRFALIARDMLASGEWLVPRVGGDIYADKPPLFFWLIAAVLHLTGSLRVAFLMPSFLSAVGCVLLVYDLATRLWRRDVGLIAALTLLFTVQFVWEARQGQIDATLCFWSTLGLYGLLRHLLLGPSWGWYVVGWVAAGFGVITKGVGFLPLLILIPYVALRARHWQGTIPMNRRLLWALGPLSFLLVIGMWLVPILIAASDGGDLGAYRDEILFQQTIERYANAWQHRQPLWYFIVNVIPVLWLPLTVLLPWLVPRWKESFRTRDSRIALLLSWIVLVIAFFSLSDGKRGVYILPAVPALALVSAPYLFELYRCSSLQRALYALALAIGVLCAGAATALLVAAERREAFIGSYMLDPLAPLVLIAIAVIVMTLFASSRRGALVYCSTLSVILLVVSFWVNPAMNASRSGAAFVQRVEQVADPERELAWVAFKEQYLLQLDRPIVHFGHARWREAEQEAFDAARWLNENPLRQLIVNERGRALCFANAPAKPLGSANRQQWFLIQGEADPTCVRKGNSRSTFAYTSPRLSDPSLPEPIRQTADSRRTALNDDLSVATATSAPACCRGARSDGRARRRHAARSRSIPPLRASRAVPRCGVQAVRSVR